MASGAPGPWQVGGATAASPASPGSWQAAHRREKLHPGPGLRACGTEALGPGHAWHQCQLGRREETRLPSVRHSTMKTPKDLAFGPQYMLQWHSEPRLSSVGPGKATSVDGRAPSTQRGPTAVSAPITLGNIHVNSDAMDTKFHKKCFSHSGSSATRPLEELCWASGHEDRGHISPSPSLSMPSSKWASHEGVPRLLVAFLPSDPPPDQHSGQTGQWMDRTGFPVGRGRGAGSGLTVNLPCGSRKGPVPWVSCPHTRLPAPRRACG